MVRRNPVRAKEMEKSRDEKLDRINIELIKQNTYLQEHIKAKGETALKKVTAKMERLQTTEWLSATLKDRYPKTKRDWPQNQNLTVVMR